MAGLLPGLRLVGILPEEIHAFESSDVSAAFFDASPVPTPGVANVTPESPPQAERGGAGGQAAPLEAPEASAANAPENVGQTTTITITYTYDALYRLRTATYSDGATFTHTYDAVGNLPKLLWEATGRAMWRPTRAISWLRRSSTNRPR